MLKRIGMPATRQIILNPGDNILAALNIHGSNTEYILPAGDFKLGPYPFDLENHHDIRIVGSGPSTRITVTDADAAAGYNCALWEYDNCQRITIENLMFADLTTPGNVFEWLSGPTFWTGYCQDITIRNIWLHKDNAAGYDLNRPLNIAAQGYQGLSIDGVFVTPGTKYRTLVNLGYVANTNVRIRNVIAQGAGATTSNEPAIYLQFGGGALTFENVIISDCIIEDWPKSLYIASCEKGIIKDCIFTGALAAQNAVEIASDVDGLILKDCHIADGLRNVVSSGQHIIVSGIICAAPANDNIRVISPATHNVIDGSILIDGGDDAIELYGDFHMVRGCILENPTWDGVLGQGTNLIVEGNAVDVCGGNGITISNVSDNCITLGNLINSTGQNGIRARNANRTAIASNIVVSPAGDGGVYVTGTAGVARNAAVIGNVVTGATNKGAILSGCEYAAFIGNILSDSGDDGLEMVSSKYNPISGNVGQGNAQYGLDEQATCDRTLNDSNVWRNNTVGQENLLGSNRVDGERINS